MMRVTSNKGAERWGTYEPFHIMLDDCRVADIVITNHARRRYAERINPEISNEGEIAAWLWQCLKQQRLKSCSGSDQTAFLIDEEVVLTAELTEIKSETQLSGQPLYSLVIVSFLGKISETPQLRDLSTYFSWLRQSRRVKLVKKNRKRR